MFECSVERFKLPWIPRKIEENMYFKGLVDLSPVVDKLTRHDTLFLGFRGGFLQMRKRIKYI